MKKRNMSLFLCIVSICLIIFPFSACKKTNQSIDIALISTEKSILDDGTFNKSAMEGIKKYTDSHSLTFETFNPEEKTDEKYLEAIDKAVNAGAKIVVTPGFNFETVIFTAQDKYPDIKFILIDGVPNNSLTDSSRVEKVAANTYSILYSEEQAGFLAGYAIVKDGYKNLGFLGGREFPAVMRYGYGFIQGAEYAGKELNYKKDEITVKYGYCGNFLKNAQNQTKAAKWYNDNTDVIFACGGAIGWSVIAAAESDNNKLVIGVDTDQSNDSNKVITSAMKMIADSIYDAIDSYYKNSFPGGKSVSLGTDTGGVGLPIDTSRFKNFTKTDYNLIYTALKTNKDGITDNIIKDTSKELSAIPLTCVKIVIPK